MLNKTTALKSLINTAVNSLTNSSTQEKRDVYLSIAAATEQELPDIHKTAMEVVTDLEHIERKQLELFQLTQITPS